MNISPISSSSSSTYSISSSSSNEYAQLENERVTLQNQLKSVNQGNDDQKTKEQKIQQLQAEIQLIDAQLQQIKAEKAAKSEGANTAQNKIQNVSLDPNLGNNLDITV